MCISRTPFLFLCARRSLQEMTLTGSTVAPPAMVGKLNVNKYWSHFELNRRWISHEDKNWKKSSVSGEGKKETKWFYCVSENFKKKCCEKSTKYERIIPGLKNYRKIWKCCFQCKWLCRMKRTRKILFGKFWIWIGN